MLSAVLDIAEGPIKRAAISDIAERWGFSSRPQFNRAVRRYFGVAPGSLLNMPEEEFSKLTNRTTIENLRLNFGESIERIARPDLLVAN